MNKQILKTIGLSFLIGFSFSYAISFAVCHLYLGSFVCFLVGVISSYTFYQKCYRKNKSDFKESNDALERLEDIIVTTKQERSLAKLMINSYSEQFSQYERHLLNLLSSLKSNNTNSSCEQVDTQPAQPENEWSKLVEIYKQSISEFPQLSDLEKMSPQSIHKTCNSIEDYRVKMNFFYEHLNNKGCEKLKKYKELTVRAEKLTKLQR